MFSEIEVQAAENEVAKKDYENLINMENESPDLMKLDKDPYGYGRNIPFLMNRQEELVVWDSRYKSNSDQLEFEVYDNLRSGNENDVLAGMNNSQHKTILKTNTTDGNAGDLNFVQMISFDPMVLALRRR